MRSAYSRRSEPASVRVRAPEPRTKSGWPTQSSSLRIEMLIAGWVRKSFSAAREKERSRATVWKTCREARSILESAKVRNCSNQVKKSEPCYGRGAEREPQSAVIYIGPGANHWREFARRLQGATCQEKQQPNPSKPSPYISRIYDWCNEYKFDWLRRWCFTVSHRKESSWIAYNFSTRHCGTVNSLPAFR